MTITHDIESDAKYISFAKAKRGESVITKKIKEWLLVDYSASGAILGIEVLNAKKNRGAIQIIGTMVHYFDEVKQNEEEAYVALGVGDYSRNVALV